MSGMASGTSSLASVHIDSDWNLRYVSSSRRYKLAEEPITESVPDFEDKILSIDSKTWFDKEGVERYCAYLDAQAAREVSKDDLQGVDELRRIPGVIAEDFHDAGLGCL